MKKGRILRILVAAFILALLIATIPEAPALAAPAIDLNPDEGEIGDEIRLDGDGFSASTTVYIYFSSDAADVGDHIGDEVDSYDRVKIMYTDGGGELFNYFDIPSRLNDGSDDEHVHGGKYYVYATYADNDYIRATADFSVIAGKITLDPEEGKVGTEVKITGTDFNTNEEITIKYDGNTVAIERGDDETDSDGDFISYIIIPSSVAYEHTIKIIDESESEAEATFTVEPEITITPTSGSAGTKVTVSGTGFIRSSNFSIFFGAEEVVIDGNTGSDGGFEINFNVPVLGPDTYVVEARDNEDNSYGAEFTVTATASISPATSETSPGNVGTEVTISGSGFAIGGTVTIAYDTIQITTETTDSKGTFSATFTVPASEGGEHIVTVTDAINAKEFTFFVESDSPSIPTLLEPATGVKAEAQTYLDWQDVTDPSGITYTMQIATEEDFASIVLRKTDLTDSEYTLTEEEKLKSVSQKSPYYWRVKAIDSASNESRWSGANSFYVGFSFSFPQWAIYILFGVGALTLAGVGFWTGRKTAANKKPVK